MKIFILCLSLLFLLFLDEGPLVAEGKGRLGPISGDSARLLAHPGSHRDEGEGDIFVFIYSFILQIFVSSFFRA